MYNRYVPRVTAPTAGWTGHRNRPHPRLLLRGRRGLPCPHRTGLQGLLWDPPGPLGDLLSRWLPSGMDREDLLILLLILATSPDDSTAGLTVALYFALA